MKEVKGDLWAHQPADLRVITTNGSIKRNGAVVMGRGCAKEARDRWSGLDRDLGARIQKFGNIPILLREYGASGVDYSWVLATFPVKYNWWEKADPALIAQSAVMLLDGVRKHDFKHVVLPRPGCGNGQLDWADVAPVLDGILDDRFSVITYE